MTESSLTTDLFGGLVSLALGLLGLEGLALIVLFLTLGNRDF